MIYEQKKNGHQSLCCRPKNFSYFQVSKVLVALQIPHFFYILFLILIITYFIRLILEISNCLIQIIQFGLYIGIIVR